MEMAVGDDDDARPDMMMEKRGFGSGSRRRE